MTRTTTPRPPSLRELALQLANDWAGSFGDRAHLLALELRLAGRSLAALALWAFAAALFVAGLWFALCVGVAAALMHAGWSWAGALMLVVIFNALAAAFALTQVTRWSRRVGLSRTLRHLRG